MTLLAFVGIALGSGTLALLTRRRPAASTAIGLFGLAAASIAASTIAPGDAVLVGGTPIEASAFVRLFLTLGCVSGLLLALVALAATWARDLPGATLLGLGASGLALAAADPLVALVALGAGGVAAIVVTGAPVPAAVWPAVAAAGLRAVVLSTALALPAVAWLARPVERLAVEPAGVGAAFLLVAVAVAVRAGSIPFHRWAARLPEAVPEAALPLVLAWGPAAFAVVALAWSDSAVAALGMPLPLERSVVAAVGAATLVLGAVAAFLHDDLEHVLTYSIVADLGVALLALSSLDPAAWEPARRWLLAFVVAKTALAGWVLAVRATFGTRRLRELGGWAGRAPLLALALAAIAVATVGWPGMSAFDARDGVVRVAVGGPAGVVLAVASLAPVLYFGRLLAVGFGRRTPMVLAGADPWPRGPIRRPALHPLTLVRAAGAAWRANAAPVGAALVLALSGLAVAVAGGGLGVADAAAAPPPGRAAPSPSPSPGPSLGA